MIATLALHLVLGCLGQGQPAEVRERMIRAGFADTISIERDLAGIERVISARRPADPTRSR